MADTGHDEFYVGYLPQAPPGIAAALRPAVAFLLVAAPAVAACLILAQGRFAPSVFEFGVVRELSGVVVEGPYPVLLVPRPGAHGEASHSRYPLVAFGKFGAAEAVSGLDGRAVRLRGSLIHRDGRTMIEIRRGTVQVLEGGAPAVGANAAEQLGQATLVGEIVDSKCFLGVMKPGNLKPHRGCAVRCISGGIPPMLVVRDAAGEIEYYLLVSPEGEPVHDRVLDLVAEPVRITGRVVRHGDQLVLHADPATYRRL